MVCDRLRPLHLLDEDGICRGCGEAIDRCDPYREVATPEVGMETARLAEMNADPTLRAALDASADAAWEAMTGDGVYDDSFDGYGDDGVDVGMPALPSQMGYEGESLGLTATPTGGTMARALRAAAMGDGLGGGW